MAFRDADLFQNSIGSLGTGTLASDPGSGGTTLTLTTGHGARFSEVLSGQTLRLQCENEVMVCTAHTASADTFTVTRGAEGTTAAAHAAGAVVNVVLTAEAQSYFLPQAARHPRQNKLHMWSFQPELIGGQSVVITQRPHVVRAYPTAASFTLTGLGVVVGVAASSDNANTYLGIYSQSGTLIAKTADISTSVRATGAVLATVTAEAGQSLSQTVTSPDTYYWLAILVGTAGATPAQFTRAAAGGSAAGNIGLSASDPFYFAVTANTGVSALPSSIVTTTFTTNLSFFMCAY